MAELLVVRPMVSTLRDENEGWLPIASGPFGRDLELAVINYGGVHALAFPCRRVLGGWMKSGTAEGRLEVHPNHWREWNSR